MLRGIFNSLIHSSARRNWRFNALLRTAKILMPEYRFHWPQMAWQDDPDFNTYLKRFNLMGSLNCHRRWLVHELTKLAQHVPGDTAECGVMEGATSYLICRAFPGRTHFGFDSFEGLSEPSNRDGNYWLPSTMSSTLETAQRNLAEFSGVHLLKGWIPAQFPEIADKRFCFVHIDVQLYEPTR